MKLIKGLLILLACGSAWASETIKIYSPYSPSHSATPAMFKILDEANKSQSVYNFVLEFKPGGNQIIALKSMDANSLGIIAPAFVENVDSGRLKESDYVPIHALGDACWAVITNGPITANRELTVGGVGFGNATHLIALALGEKYGFTTKYIVFKSNNDALINMAGDNGIFMVIDRYESYEAMHTKNPKLQVFAASCLTRLEQAPKVKTLKEIGIDAPYVFNITVAPATMDATRRRAIAIILNDAQNRVGSKVIYQSSGMRLSDLPADKFYEKSVATVRNLQARYRKEIDAAQK